MVELEGVCNFDRGKTGLCRKVEPGRILYCEFGCRAGSCGSSLPRSGIVGGRCN